MGVNEFGGSMFRHTSTEKKHGGYSMAVGALARHMLGAALLVVSVGVSAGEGVKSLSLSYGSSACHQAFKSNNVGQRADLFTTQTKEQYHTRISKTVADEFLKMSGPFNQPMAFSQYDGRNGIFGTEVAVSRARRDVYKLKGAVFDIALHKNQDIYNTSVEGDGVKIHMLPSLIGSAVVRRGFGDLDINSTLMVESGKFHYKDFTNPNSLTVKAIAKYLITFARQKRKEGYIFSDFKAGEYDFVPQEQAETKSRAIKWTYKELLAGEKSIETGYEGGPKRTLTLEEAITHQGRIKIDLIAKVDNMAEIESATGIRDRFIECTVMFILGGKRTGLPPVLSIADRDRFPESGATGANLTLRDRATEVPLRATTVFFEGAHAEKARQLSVNAPRPDISYLNNVMLGSAKTYLKKGNLLKALRILYTRTLFWTDTQYAFDAGFNRQELYRSLENIIYGNQKIEELNILVNIGETLNDAINAGLSVSPRGINEYYNGLNRYLKTEGMESATLKFDTIEESITYIKENLINRILEESLSKNENVRRYLSWVKGLEYDQNYSRPQETNSFVALKVSKEFQKNYEELYSQWKEAYPNIRFTHPSDVHMTLSFLGRVKQDSYHSVVNLVRLFIQKIDGLDFILQNPELEIVGKSNTHIALTFDKEAVPAKVREAIIWLKRELQKQGIAPDKFDIHDFLPHISLAFIRDTMRDPNTHMQVPNFMYEANLEGLAKVEFTPQSVELLRQKEIIEPVFEESRFDADGTVK